jgi:hypothetical protein
MKVEKPRDEPVLLVKWYDYTKWVLDRVDGFPKNQRFVLTAILAYAKTSSRSGRSGLMNRKQVQLCGSLKGTL